MILAVLAVLAGGLPANMERKEIPIPDGADADVRIVARIRGGLVELDILEEVTAPHGDV